MNFRTQILQQLKDSQQAFDEANAKLARSAKRFGQCSTPSRASAWA